jgi:hypothetical protein
VKQQRNAILWAIGWWLVRRQVRRRAVAAVAGVGATATATAQRGRARSVLGAVLLVGVLAAGFVAARKLLSGGEASEAPPLPDRPSAPDVSSFPDAAGAPGEPEPGPAAA